MYGTDWTMILPQERVENYLQEFIRVMDEVEQSTLKGAAPRGTTLSNAFFGANAVNFLGLKRGQRNRARLEAFYGRHEVSTPDWVTKTDRL